jgi:hypothetical protein
MSAAEIVLPMRAFVRTIGIDYLGAETPTFYAFRGSCFAAPAAARRANHASADAAE